MERKHKFVEFFKNPNIIMTVCLWVVGFVLLGGCIASIVLDFGSAGIRIAVILPTSLVFVYAAYGTAMLTHLPLRIKRRAFKHKYLALFISDYNFRTIVYACVSVVIDLAYAAMEFIIGRITGNGWYTVNATYYFGISLIRFCVIMFGARKLTKLPHEKRRLHEIKVYTAVGIALLLINGWLTTTFIVSLTGGSEFEKSALIVYGTAIYTFYRTVFAVGGLIKSHKEDSLITRSLRALSTVTALVSILTFFSALAATFNEFNSARVANGVIGNFISLFCISMSIFMLVQSYRYNRKLQKTANDAETGG